MPFFIHPHKLISLLYFQNSKLIFSVMSYMSNKRTSILQSECVDNVSSPFIRTYSITGASLLKTFARSLNLNGNWSHLSQTSSNIFFKFSIHSMCAHNSISSCKCPHVFLISCFQFLFSPLQELTFYFWSTSWKEFM